MGCETGDRAEQGERAAPSPNRTDGEMEVRWGILAYYPHASGRYRRETCLFPRTEVWDGSSVHVSEVSVVWTSPKLQTVSSCRLCPQSACLPT